MTCKCIINDLYDVGKDFKVSDMATYCQVSRQTIYNVLNNKKEPSVSLAMLITDFINDYLYSDWHDESWTVEDFFKYV